MHGSGEESFALVLSVTESIFLGNGTDSRRGYLRGGVLSPFLWILFTLFLVPEIRRRCTLLNLVVTLAFFVFAGDLTMTISHENITTLNREAHEVARVTREVYADLKLKISPIKSFNFLINPFCLGDSFLK